MVSSSRGPVPRIQAPARSTWKLNRILDDHPGLVAALRDHVMAGNSVIFVVGNHDMELLWPGVQAALRKRLPLTWTLLRPRLPRRSCRLVYRERMVLRQLLQFQHRRRCRLVHSHPRL
jgi:hypothetical protein